MKKNYKSCILFVIGEMIMRVDFFIQELIDMVDEIRLELKVNEK